MTHTLLQHLVEMTSCHTRKSLDGALLRACADLGTAQECALWFARQSGSGCLCWQAGKMSAATVEVTHAFISEQLENELQRCRRLPLRYRREAAPGSLAHTWLPVWQPNGHDASACLHVTSALPLEQSVIDILQGVLRIYANFGALLDDNEHDSLTGLLNRKTFDRRFAELVGSVDADSDFLPALEAERRGLPPTAAHWLGVIDIDHFKQVNDQFGHVYGDEVLILLANILKSAFRQQDRVYRFGGEEFVVLLRAASLEHARGAFERVRAQVANQAFPQINRVTISAGFVSISPDTPVTILGHADQALYFAKENGRNQVCYYDELVSSGQLGHSVGNQDVEFF
jgi:diguanylate cyclase (GGDEF)-like protein